MIDFALFPSAELVARDALAKYKLALIMTGHRSVSSAALLVWRPARQAI